ncbi:MAG: DNA-3-methyladenine glycosylase [Oscillospiraceae bacterium]|nr:DNA-3-methyladenine glycosylase [Oscillospiraceae bacterium]
MDKLPREFYNRDTLTVAKGLLGQRLVRVYQGQPLICRIIETEAYIGRRDRACHAYQYKRTSRTQTLFTRPGTAYIYMIYGMYHCLNLVTEPEGEPAAVLIRGLEPIDALEQMARLRYGLSLQELTTAQRKNWMNGPGKLCKALSLDKSLNGADLLGETLYVLPGTQDGPIHSGPRIGIDYAGEDAQLPWRFWL